MMKINRHLRWLLLPLLFLALAANTPAQADDKPEIYTVKKGDCLVRIATEYGNPNYWFLIYEANKDKIARPELIFPGQQFVIPESIQPEKPETAVVDSTQLRLDAFRQAFNALQKKKSEPKPVRQTVDAGLEFGGMVIDETQSKIGRDFYDAFYRYWAAPRGINNFVITITEQPLPTLGTMVFIEINDTPVFRNRLQPRYDYIQEVGKSAVVVCYRWLAQQSQQPTISVY